MQRGEYTQVLRADGRPSIPLTASSWRYVCVILVSMPVWTVGNIRFGQRGGEGEGRVWGKETLCLMLMIEGAIMRSSLRWDMKDWVVTSDWGRGKRG